MTKDDKEFISESSKEFEEPVFEPRKIAGLNDITINSGISIE